ncbi:glucosylceramide transporter ABCA12 [Cololabis saira]|uniref:glucosylceramide transporter ABCA12 n=1 Tax=Cololabis saira TaxID=129043 RepID=UPI002AD2BA79|nr:glucosylceramide transporter ABCA12 [Cololabis saira]XP_061579712.1 glucosylceramide transporter ABCA12 [Cololabis saira]
MAALRQLRLLLWKNGLGVIRQPLWSLTLIAWPLVVFILIAVTRNQFPAVVRDACYVGPRNLPSTGFFPFLQTLMCNTDSNCHNTSRLADSSSSRSSRDRRSANSVKTSPLATLIQGGDFFKFPFPNGSHNDPAALVKVMENMFGSSYSGDHNNVTLMSSMNTTLHDQETWNKMLESVNIMKRAICTVTLPMINRTSPSTFTYAVVTFCNSNNTVFEVSLNTFNQLMTEMMLTQPDEMLSVAGMTVSLFHQLQNDTSLWENLVALPQLFSPGSVDQALNSTKALLTNIQGVMHVIQRNFNETGAAFATVHPFLAGGINLLDYIQNWPGKDVTISLGDVVTMHNDTLSDLVKRVLQEVQIPLDKAVGLTLDKDMVRSYLCGNTSEQLWLATACSTGAVDMLLGWISPDKVAKQTLLAWSKHVAAHDLSFAKGLLHSLMGDLSSGVQGSSGVTRSQRSIDTQPQNIEEELFLEVGQVLLEIVKSEPELDMVVQSVLRTGFQSMKAAKLTVQTVEEMMNKVLADADQLQLTYHMLLTNQSEASMWINRALDSVMEMIMKTLESKPPACEELLRPFEWLLSTESVKVEVWRSLICQNSSSLQQALMMDWMTWFQEVQEVYSALTGQADFNVTLPMILSEWHDLYNSSLQFGGFLDRLLAELGGAYRMNWIPDNTWNDVTGTLQQSVVMFMVDFGEMIENSEMWPEVKNYFHMIHWILNYRPGVASQPANCSVDTQSLALHCETGLKWPQFVETIVQALMSPSQDVVVNSLKGAVNLLQHVYGDMYSHLIASYLKQEIKGGDALSDSLTNLMLELDGFVKTISILPNQNISDPNVMVPLISDLLQSTGLQPLLPLLLHEGPVNISTVLHVASKLSRFNQHLFTFNETDPTMPELEQLIMQLLSLESNLTVSLPHIMGQSLLMYSSHLNPDDVARLKEAIQPFTNQTSAGLAEAILCAMELLQTMVDSPNGDPTDIILGYLRQLQEFVVSLYRLRLTEGLIQSGQLNVSEVSDLHMVSMDFLNLLTPEGLLNLTQAGPNVSQDIVINKFVAFLPPPVRSDAIHFLQDFKALQDEMTKCSEGQNCLAGFSEVFTFLDQIVDMMLSANGSVTLEIAPINSIQSMLKHEEISSTFFSLLLSPGDAAIMETFKQTLHFIKLVMSTPNITVSSVQNALEWSNLTMEELNGITALAGAANISDLMVNVMGIVNVQQCFEPQNNQTVTAQCVMGLINGVSGFLANLPALHNDKDILSLIQLIVNKTISDVMQVDFSSDPSAAIVHTLNTTLANIKMSLHVHHLNTPDIIKEIRMLEGLIKLVTNMEPYENITLIEDPLHAQQAYLELIGWYLKNLENITSNSSVSELLHPLFDIAHMQVTSQLAQTNFSIFVSEKVEFLVNSLQYPINGDGVREIGQAAVELIRRMLDYIRFNIEIQNNTYGFDQLVNTTLLHSTEHQIKLYLDLIEQWMKQPSVPSLLTSMLQWGNSSMTASVPVEDLHHLMETMLHFASDDQLAYLSMINNITQSLSKVLMVAEQTGGLQSEHLAAAISEIVQRAMQVLTTFVAPLPPAVEEDILEIVQDSLNLIVNANMSFASSRNISLLILKRAERVIHQIIPEMFAEYLIMGIRVITTYFESAEEVSGVDQWNQIILNEMMTVQSFLPPNSTAQAYVSTLINITHFILDSGQGNMSLWTSFAGASLETLPEIIGQMSKLFSMFWQLVMGGTGSHAVAPSLEGFAHLVPVLEQVMTGKANQSTWEKLEELLKTILSTFEGTDVWNDTTNAIPLLEKAIERVVKNTHAENEMILSLQIPVIILIKDIAATVNASNINLSELSEEMQHAIDHTVQAAQQANGTLKCSEALKIWESVRETAELNDTSFAMWCAISLQPVLEAYAETQTVYSHLNMSHMGVGPMSVSDAAGRIVKTVQSLYEVSINRTMVMQEFIMTFSSLFSELTGQTLSLEAQMNWYKQLQDMQLQNSLSSIEQLSDELLAVAPFLRPYTEATLKALSYVLDNYHLVENSSTSQDLFGEAAMIFLTSANITSNDIFSIMWGNPSGVNKTLLTEMIRDAIELMIDMNVFGDSPMIYHELEKLLASNDTSLMVENLVEMSLWLASTKATGVDLLSQLLPKMYDVLRPLLSVLTGMNVQLPPGAELFEDLAGNIIAMFRQLVSTSGLLPNMDQQVGAYHSEMAGGHHMMRVRQRRDLSTMMTRNPMDDIVDLFYIDYPALFRSISEPPTTTEMMETVHVLFSNPDLNVVMKGLTSDMPWALNASREETIDAALGMFSYVTHPGMSETPSMDLLVDAVNILPDGFPFSSEIKNITTMLAMESQETLLLLQKTFQTTAELLQISPTDPRFTEKLRLLRSQVCALENTESMQLLVSTLSIEPGQLCHTFLPSLQILAESLLMNSSSMSEVLFQTVVGDPRSYDVQTNWTSLLSQGLGFNTSDLDPLHINFTSPGMVTFGELLKNSTAFVQDMEQYTDFNPAALHLLMGATLPNNSLEILAWFTNLHYCNTRRTMKMEQADMILLQTFCSMSVEEWYKFSLLMVQHLNMEKFLYRLVLSEETQMAVGVILKVAEVLTDMMDKIIPAVSQLQSYLRSIEDLNLGANNEFHQMARGQRASISSRATFVTLSRALCSNGILALFGISKIPEISESSPSFNHQQREEMIERFKIPRNATPFCTNMYLDMVNTTGGAIAWAFLKPMLMGQILYTPDTPTTRAIMEKANTTLQEFANLRENSEDWIESSKYIIRSAELLGTTLPMLQNSLGNSFVRNFIEMQTNINVDGMKETLNSFSNMTEMMEKNKHILGQITTLSNLMVKLSSCIKFDRYHGYDSAEELNNEAQELAKNRELYASVIFKLPEDSSRKREARSSSSSASSLPPKVSYTIRMHMDNVMRTDRVRNPYFVKDTHISASQTMRYNRGFIYLQENIDRAIIETQTGHRVTDPAVQLQPFPYPCFLRDEYLEAVSFVFPLMLMIAWVLFVAEFVKKLVHERELRLHEYMKMMGVNPLSHFFAWFLECAGHLLLTILILTLVLKYGDILPNSDGFLIFLYLCDYGLTIIAFSFLVSSFFDKTYIAGLSGSLLYILFFFPFIVVMALETNLTFSQKSALSLFSPTCYSYASQYASRYESQGEGIQWSNAYMSPIPGDTGSFGWLCWLMLIDSILYFIIGAYIRMVFPGKYGIPAPWYFPFKLSFWADLCCCIQSKSSVGKGLLFSNIMQKSQPVFSEDKGKGKSALSYNAGEDLSALPVGVALHGLTKVYGDQAAIQNLNISFYEGHVTSLLGHNGAGKTTAMSLLTGLYAPSSGTIEVYGNDMQTNIDKVRKELGVCMQYDVLFDHMTTKEHLLLYGQIKAPHWSRRELHEQVRTILEETGMHAHRHKRVGSLSGGMKRKLSISIAFIGGSRLVVLDEPTTGVDPCSRRSIWDIVIQHKSNRTIIMSTHHLDEAEVLSDRIALLERGGLKCCGSPLYLKDKLGQGYKLTLTKKIQNAESEQFDSAELKAFIQAHVTGAHLKEAQGSDIVYSLPPFTSSNASSYRSLLTALDANLDDLQLGGYGISDTTLEEVFLQLTNGPEGIYAKDGPVTVSETVSDSASIDSFPSDLPESCSNLGDKMNLASSSSVSGVALAWQQMTAVLIKRFHHSRRDWKGLLSQILLPVVFVAFAMCLGSIRSDLRHYPELELSPALYNIGPAYSFFSNQNPQSNHLVDTMMSFPGIDNACLDKSDNQVCTRSKNKWSSRGNNSKPFSVCKCTRQEQICSGDNFQPPHKKIPSSQTVYNLNGINVENYLVATANDFIRNRYGGFAFGMPLPADLQMDLRAVPKKRTLSKVWFNPEGHHSMPAYLNSLNNLILRSNIPAEKDPNQYAISVSSHPYFGRADDEDAIVQGMLQILVAMCVLTGYSITTASFAIYEVNEHHSGSKRLQHIAGISEAFYWSVNFFYDMVMYLIPVTLTVAVIAAFQIPAFTDRQNLAAITLLLVLFGFATFPWMYLLSGVFKDAEMAFITYVCINLFISVNTIISTSVFYFLGQISMLNPEVIQDIFKKLSHAFLIFPQFNFGNGLMQLARMNIEVQILSGYGIDPYINPFSTESLGWMFISSFIQGLVFFTLRLLLNKSLMRKVRHLIMGRKTVPQVTLEDEDEDVATENLRVSTGAASSDLLQVNQLSKIYEHLKNKVYAVNRLSVGIPAGECFGLLGVNGAGKTTTFKMLTGDVSPTDGSAQIRDYNGRLVDIMECRNKGINIGYCPQEDALDALLTGEEHLYFYARIRGISKREIDGVVNYLLRRLELNYHRNIITDGYSCGTRRKLSTALALVGHPQILLLDEPSSGMDPHTKRHLWKIISEEVKGKCAVVLTSHSMEECEALCSRLAIMVKGQFRCLGSLQHIKNRFGSGFTVKMYLAEASYDAEAITRFMQRRFPSTYLKEQHSTMVEYHVPVAPGGVADIFDQLESNKNALQIKHFSVSQTTLDEVFINFALGNIGMETIPIQDEDNCEGLDSIKAVQT